MALGPPGAHAVCRSTRLLGSALLAPVGPSSFQRDHGRQLGRHRRITLCPFQLPALYHSRVTTSSSQCPPPAAGGRGERKVGSGAGRPPEPFRRGSDSGRLPKGRRQKGVSSVRTVQGAGERVGQGQARGCLVSALCEGDRPGERIPQHERRQRAGAESRGASALETEPRPQRGAHPATWTVPDRRGCRAFSIPQARGPSPGCGGSGVLGRR